MCRYNRSIDLVQICFFHGRRNPRNQHLYLFFIFFIICIGTLQLFTYIYTIGILYIYSSTLSNAEIITGFRRPIFYIRTWSAEPTSFIRIYIYLLKNYLFEVTMCYVVVLLNSQSCKINK